MIETLRRGFRFLGAIVAGLLVLALAYTIAGLVGGAIPANADWREPDAGVPIWVESNGIHVGLIVPKIAAGIDWQRFAPAGDLGDPRYARFDHLAIGWGERAFYLETPTWADVKLHTILAAARGSDETLLHVEHVPAPKDNARVRRIILRPDEYRRLAAAIAATKLSGGQRYRGYGAYDVFYQARGHYSGIRTCNAWTGAMLRQAGVRVGMWTPFPVTVTAWF